jgi:small subunit ribosomal protein S17
VSEEPDNNETTEEETPQPEAPEAEAPAEQPEAEAAPAAEDAPVEEPAAEEPAAAAPAVAPEEPEEEALGPKQRRKRERSRHTGEALPSRTPEQRAAERAERRARRATIRRARRAAERSKRTPGTGTPPAERAAGTRAVRQGTVVSDKADKTITVRLEIVRRHPKYEKIVRRTAKVHAHDEQNDAHVGDVVRVIEARPRSRTKRWRLVEVLERAR